MGEVLSATQAQRRTSFPRQVRRQILHKGQAGLGNDKLKQLICVGLSYFIVAIIVPVIILSMTGAMSGDWTFKGTMWSMMAGAAGAIGALGIILALTSGGSPIYVMPLVFGCAPIVNVFVSMYFQGIPVSKVSPIFIAGMILVSVGAVTVLVFQPKADKAGHGPKPEVKAKESPDAEPQPEEPEPEPKAESPADDAEGASDSSE